MDTPIEGIEQKKSSFLSPEQKISDFNLGCKEKLDYICYEDHPAYEDFIRSATGITRVKALTKFGYYLCIRLIKKLISYEAIPAHLRKPKSINEVYLLFLMIASRKLSKRILNPSPFQYPGEEKIFSTLQKHGICVIKPDSKSFDKVVQLSLPAFSALREKRQQNAPNRQFSDSRYTALRPEYERLYDAVECLFSEIGIFEAVSKHIGRSVKLIDINPQINDSSDDFWLIFFPDLDIAKPKTVYYHRDASGGDVKVIMYLTDVELENGPFSYVLGSHKTRPSRFLDLVQEVNDSSGLSLTDLEERKLFAALPSVLRSKCAFGNDLLDSSNMAHSIKASEWQVIGSKGHMVVFVSKGIHRGGMVLDKERVVITCVLS